MRARITYYNGGVDELSLRNIKSWMLDHYKEMRVEAVAVRRINRMFGGIERKAVVADTLQVINGLVDWLREGIEFEELTSVKVTFQPRHHMLASLR